MTNRSSYTWIAILLASFFFQSCKKDKETVVEVPESPKPTTDFTFKLVSTDDPFTFKFENNSTNYQEVRWEFGDDSTTTEVSPLHTYINTGDYRIRVIAKNDQGYWAQKETIIKLRPDTVLSFGSTAGVAGKLVLSVNTPVKTSAVAWYKGTGTTAVLVAKTETAEITIPSGTNENYTVKITTPKGSKAELTRQVSSKGVLKDVTGLGKLAVSRDNDSGPNATEGSLKLVDNNVRSKFVQFNYIGDLWARLDFGQQPVILGGYSITSAEDAVERDPKSFNLEGSDDLSTWTVLDQRNSEAFTSRGLTKTYIFDNTKAFRYYRLNIVANNSAGLIQIAEWRTLVIQ